MSAVNMTLPAFDTERNLLLSAVLRRPAAERRQQLIDISCPHPGLRQTSYTSLLFTSWLSIDGTDRRTDTRPLRRRLPRTMQAASINEESNFRWQAFNCLKRLHSKLVCRLHDSNIKEYYETTLQQDPDAGKSCVAIPSAEVSKSKNDFGHFRWLNGCIWLAKCDFLLVVLHWP